ncbi:TonB-dependent receptor [Pontibacter cellulosilyticus]|uniref:TonB-dependent receptor n=1 Tax=Pontibacter cellulosilyticus TaxID=1720253 RepID=A0A923NAF3_9BACT|nr:TonB-dependent receptor [Pontibacter cellulosilyticus]MBC5994782.1 TonB-dependent receptor [Pontibacter cellulosilyticus]
MLQKVCKAILLLLLLFQNVVAQQPEKKLYKLSGVITDATGERLSEAFVFISPGEVGVLTNKQGRFSVKLEKGTYEVVCQYIGMAPLRETVILDNNKEVVLTLGQQNVSLRQVEITTNSIIDLNSVRMGSSHMDQKLLTRMPKLMGEADVLKAVSALPGVVNAGGGTSGFFVRGGSADQNLVLMDGAPLFNATHLFGFFSVYNSDVLKSFDLHRSGISATYGGRISSILDVKMQDGNTEKMKYEVGLTPVTAKLSMDGPISDKATVLVALRGAYPDYLLNLFPSENIKNSSGFFYDGNLKLKYKLSEKDNVSFSGYRSADGFKFPYDTTYHWTNTLGSLRWNHLFSDSFVGSATLVKSIYKNTVAGLAIGEEFKLNSGIDLSQAKIHFGFFGLKNHSVDFGGEVSYYEIQPGELVPSGTSNLNPRTLMHDKGYESALYLNDEVKLNEKLSFSLGVRYARFSKIGPSDIYIYAEGKPRDDRSITDTLHVGAGNVVQTYQGLEPRASFKYSLSNNASLKAGLSRTRQFIQLISNTAAITPVDIWKLSDRYIKPQVSDQVSVGYFYLQPDNVYELSWEVYYKRLYNQIDYKDGAVLLLNPALDADLLFGDGYAYGSEWLLKKNQGRLTGWLSATYSRSLRKIEGETEEETINEGKPYPSNYDKPVNLNIFANYQAWPKWTVSANFTYTTGRPITAADSWYRYHDQVFANYVGRNQQRMPDYHRLDVAFNHEPIIKKNAVYEWGISVYNLYSRKNAYSTLYQHYYGAPPGAFKLSIIGVPIPSVNVNVKF